MSEARKEMTPEEEAAFIKKWGGKPAAAPTPPKQEQIQKQGVMSELLRRFKRGDQLDDQQRKLGI